ncbi:FHA domain-containing protein [bacterium]|nr:FHA domain-containing protein [bacterium]
MAKVSLLPLFFLGFVVVVGLVVLGIVVGVLVARKGGRREPEGTLPPLRPEALGAPPAPATAPAPTVKTAGDTASGRTAIFSFPSLLVKDHYGLENTYRLEFGDFHLGSGADNDLVVGDEEGVLPRQARIRLEGAAYVLENLGAPEGLRLNGAAVQRQSLKNDDVITLGKTTIRVTGLSV